MEDQYIGKVGTPERDEYEYEYELRMDILGRMIKTYERRAAPGDYSRLNYTRRDRSYALRHCFGFIY